MEISIIALPLIASIISGFFGKFIGDRNSEIVTSLLVTVSAIFFAVPWQVVLFLCSMMIVLKQWSNFLNLFILLIILSAGLYWFWFRHLSKEVKV